MNGMGLRTKLVGVCLVIMGCSLVATPQIYAFLNLDFWSIPKLQREIEETEEFTAEMERMNEIVHDRIQKKEEYIRALEMEKLSYVETVDRFVDLNSMSPRFIGPRHLSLSDDEKFNAALSVVYFAHAMPLPNVDRHTAFVKRVQKEFHRLYPVSPN